MHEQADVRTDPVLRSSAHTVSVVGDSNGELPWPPGFQPNNDLIVGIIRTSGPAAINVYGVRVRESGEVLRTGNKIVIVTAAGYIALPKRVPIQD